MTNAREIEERAALWLLRSEETGWSNDDQRRLDDWLAQSDAHKAAFWRLEYGWRGADRIAALGLSPAAERPRYDWERSWRPFAVAASIVLAFTAFLALNREIATTLPDSAKIAAFQTAVGGHKVVNLPDGSRVELNTATMIRAELDGDQRRVWLDRGEAYFEVAKNPARPFVVLAGSRNVTVLGTKFLVRRTGSKVVVAVLEGHVRVDEIGSAVGARSTTIATGDTAVAEGATTLVKADAEQQVEEQLGWRTGMLLFDSTTLSDAAAEFNRYNRKALVIEDPAAAQIRIGGSFEAKNVSAFARLLKDAYGLRVRSDGDKIFVSS